MIKETAKLAKMLSKLDKNKRKGKLTEIEIEKEHIRISKQQIEIRELHEEIDKAEKKLNKLRS
ncbi:hypothetical protein [Flavobacterium wongokense]|uniref:hypothetical protein n=1 Tax=Flavobacterium wongokense TaxID=2910674 RepID=UPI001F36BEB2|nr:hypothetical protein [Flavobacterium sp. WG47]MCF6130996.1 hypothetical protein [Flavobacterium sp. WG47]